MNSNELKEKLEQLEVLLCGLNAHGVLDLEALKIIESFIKGAFSDVTDQVQK